MSAEYDGQNRRGWSIKKEISIGDAIAIVVGTLAALGAWSNLNTRVALLEQARIEQSKNDERQDSEAARYQARIDKSLEEINRKLDRLIETGGRR